MFGLRVNKIHILTIFISLCCSGCISLSDILCGGKEQTNNNYIEGNKPHCKKEETENILIDIENSERTWVIFRICTNKQTNIINFISDIINGVYFKKRPEKNISNTEINAFFLVNKQQAREVASKLEQKSNKIKEKDNLIGTDGIGNNNNINNEEKEEEEKKEDESGRVFYVLVKDITTRYYMHDEYGRMGLPLFLQFQAKAKQEKFKYSIEIVAADTSEVTDMGCMFMGCVDLTEIRGLEKFNTSNVTNMMEMFHNCSNLESLSDISGWYTGKVTNMHGMFFKCTSLKRLPDISKWKKDNVKDDSFMF